MSMSPEQMEETVKGLTLAAKYLLLTLDRDRAGRCAVTYSDVAIPDDAANLIAAGLVRHCTDDGKFSLYLKSEGKNAAHLLRQIDPVANAFAFGPMRAYDAYCDEYTVTLNFSDRFNGKSYVDDFMLIFHKGDKIVGSEWASTLFSNSAHISIYRYPEPSIPLPDEGIGSLRDALRPLFQNLRKSLLLSEIENIQPLGYINRNNGSHLRIPSDCWIGQQACREALAIAEATIGYTVEADKNGNRQWTYYDAEGSVLSATRSQDTQWVIEDYTRRLTGREPKYLLEAPRLPEADHVLKR
jgi:hypothetical protein